MSLDKTQCETVALIVAAGRGSRATRHSSDTPKQYAPINGLEVICYGMKAFLQLTQIDKVLVVIHRDDVAAYNVAKSKLDQQITDKLLPPVFGGDTRQKSVCLGLEALSKEYSPKYVLIHDGARPFIESSLIIDICNGLHSYAGILPALPVVDTLKTIENSLVKETVDRAGLWRAQTPQGFKFKDILKAHLEASSDLETIFTDDASIAEWARLDVHVIEGSEENIKITTSEDFHRGEFILGKNIDVRVGNGFDVHAFMDGDEIILCGVTLPFHKKLKGHSDADVGLHAITDAIYGALGAGDIGTHFPPSDSQWKGAASDLFLKHAVSLIEAKGGRLSNIDVTLICEAPKIGPHSQAMREKVAEITGLRVDQVSVKATTTERLGFTGREEGIAALASALIIL